MEAGVSSLAAAYLQRLSTRSRLGLAGTLCCLAYTWLVVLSWGHIAIDLRLFFLTMSLAWGATLGVYWMQRNTPEPFPRNHMLVWGMLFRVLGVLGQPVLEDDYYRYLWDGRTFAVSGNPYVDRPSDHFTDAEIPAEFHKILDNINYPYVPTIYGPICQYAFLVSYWLAPGKLFPLKLLLVLADILTIWLLLKVAKPAHVLLYAWCPLLIQETAFTAHPDALGVMFLVAALYAYTRERGSLTAIFAALAVGTKMPAGLLVPFLLCQAGRKNWMLFGGTLLAVYLPFWSQGSLGAMSGMAVFLQDWEFNSSGYGLLATWLGSQTAKLVCAVLVGTFCLCHLWSCRSHPRSTIPRGDWLYGVFFLLSPVVNPWYLLWLLPFVTLFPSSWGVTALVVVSLSYAHGLYIDDVNLPPYCHPAWVRPIEFGMIALAGLYDVWWCRRSRSKRHGQ